MRLTNVIPAATEKEAVPERSGSNLMEPHGESYGIMAHTRHGLGEQPRWALGRRAMIDRSALPPSVGRPANSC